MNTYKIDHILKFDIAYYKKNLGENLDMIGIIVTTTRKFAVIYRRDAQKRLYNVDYFGNGKTMPSSSCPDWKMLAYSCKHFFAIFKKYASWDWNWLSKLFKIHHIQPLMKMLKIQQNLKHNLSIRMQMIKLFITKTSDIVMLEELPSKKRKVKNRVHGEAYRSLLNEVKSLRFLNENNQEKINRVFSVL